MITLSATVLHANAQTLEVRFETAQSKVVEDKKTDKIKHYIPVILKGKLTSDVALKAKIHKSGTHDSKNARLFKPEVYFKVKDDKKDKTHEYQEVLGLEIDYNQKKLKGLETIVIEIQSQDGVDITTSFHTVVIEYEGQHNFLMTSIGTNFDYLNGGAQAKKLYWDLNYFNPAINNSNLFIRSGIYQNRNFTIDSTGNTRNPYTYELVGKRLDQASSNPVDTTLFQRQTYNITSDQLTSDNTALFIEMGVRSNQLSDQTNFYLGVYNEIILRRFTRTTSGALLGTDTFSVTANRGDRLGPFLGTPIGTTTWSALDSYVGLNVSIHHIAKNVEFMLSPSFLYGWYDVRSSNPQKGVSGLIKLMVRERNSGVKLGVEYRTAGSTNDIFLINLSKTFSVSKADLFKKV